MRIDDRHGHAPDVMKCLRLVYDVAAMQRANANLGIGFVAIDFHPEFATLTIEQPGHDAVEIDVDYSASRGEGLPDALIAAGFPARPAPPDDGTMGMPLPSDSHLLKHAWIMKMIAYGSDPWTVYGRIWSGDLLRIHLSSTTQTEAVFRIDGHKPILTVSISHEQDHELLGLNYGIVDGISAYFGGWRQRRQLSIEKGKVEVRILM